MAEVCYTVEETADAIKELDISIAEVAKRHVDTPEGVRTALDTLVMATRSA